MPAASPIPDNYPRMTPYLAVDGAEAAIAFYTDIFGMRERSRMQLPDGRIGHAELEIGDSLLMISDEFPEMGVRGPKSVGGSPTRLSIYVEDVDAVWQRAIAAGAQEVRPLDTHFYGDRSGQVEDPWGQAWNLTTRVEDLTPEEIEARAKIMFPE